MLNVVKIIIVLALLAFLVLRLRGRKSATAPAGSKPAGGGSSQRKPARSLPSPLGRLRGRKGSPKTTAAQPRLRPRLTVTLPHATPAASLDESASETPDDPADQAGADAQLAAANAPDPVAGDVAQPAATDHQANESSEVPAPLVRKPGWPVPGEFGAPLDFDAFDPDPDREPDDTPAAADAADLSFADWTPALEDPAPAAQEVAWTEVDVLQTGVDDEVPTPPEGGYPPADDAAWSDDSFDPASGWTDSDLTEGQWTTPNVTFSELDPAAADDPGTAGQPAGDMPPATEAQLSSWETGDWSRPSEPSAPAPAPAADGAPAPPPYAAADFDEWDEGADEAIVAASRDDAEPFAWSDVVPEEPTAPLVADPAPIVADTPADLDELPAPDVLTPTSDPAPAAHHFASDGWDAVDEPEQRFEVAAAAPMQLHLTSGERELHVVIEHDDLGNPTAWVLSGSAIAVDGAVRVTVPTADAAATATIEGVDLDEPLLDEPHDPLETAALAARPEPVAERVVEEAAPSTEAPMPAADAIAELAHRLAEAEREIAELRTREAALETQPVEPIRPAPHATPPARRRTRTKKTAPSAAAGRKSGPRNPRRAASPAPAPQQEPVSSDAHAALSIAELVQAEANRRVAAVLAEHGAVKSNGNFTGLVDRLEHVSEHAPSERA